MMLRSWFYLLVVIGFTGVLTMVLIWTGPQGRATLQPPAPPLVVTTEIQEIDFQPLTRLTGQLQPMRRSRLQFEVSGQVSKRYVEPGQRVDAGDVLLEVEPGDFKDAAIEAEAALQQEREALARDRQLLELMQRQVNLQQQEVQRMKTLGRESLASKSNYDNALQSLLQLQSEAARLRHNIGSATARLSQLQAVYNRAKRNLERTRLRSPFAATVDEVAVDVGDYVTPAQLAVKLVKLDQLDLALEVPASVIASLSLNQGIELVVGDREHRGRIVALAPDPDPRTHTYSVRIRLPGDGLFAGQLAEARLPGQYYANASMVPATAVLHDEGKTYVFAVNDDTLNRRPVTVLQSHSDWRAIKGAPPGLRIVARDVAALADGQQVTVREDRLVRHETPQ